MEIDATMVFPWISQPLAMSEDIRIHQHLHQFSAKLRKRQDFCLSELRSSWSEPLSKNSHPFFSTRLQFHSGILTSVTTSAPKNFAHGSLPDLHDTSIAINSRPRLRKSSIFLTLAFQVNNQDKSAPSYHLLSNYHYSRRQSSRWHPSVPYQPQLFWRVGFRLHPLPPFGERYNTKRHQARSRSKLFQLSLSDIIARNYYEPSYSTNDPRTRWWWRRSTSWRLDME